MKLFTLKFLFSWLTEKLMYLSRNSYYIFFVGFLLSQFLFSLSISASSFPTKKLLHSFTVFQKCHGHVSCDAVSLSFLDYFLRVVELWAPFGPTRRQRISNNKYWWRHAALLLTVTACDWYPPPSPTSDLSIFAEISGAVRPVRLILKQLLE